MNESPQVWIGTSWKMNKTLADATEFAETLIGAESEHPSQIQQFVIPPFTVAREVKQKLAGGPVKVGAQNMHWANEGAWTGEISPVMLKDCKLDLVELGHSERRTHFGETNQTVGLKTEAAVRHGLIPLICVGETLAERDAGRAQHVLETQVREALGKLSAAQKQSVILFAYEPVWAIGEHGSPAAPDYANARQAEIIDSAEAVLGQRAPCLYGGSVNFDNCGDLITHEHIDGLFIGRSAWNASDYINILARCAAVL